jgi:hypothetical protein
LLALDANGAEDKFFNQIDATTATPAHRGNPRNGRSQTQMSKSANGQLFRNCSLSNTTNDVEHEYPSCRSLSEPASEFDQVGVVDEQTKAPVPVVVGVSQVRKANIGGGMPTLMRWRTESSDVRVLDR